LGRLPRNFERCLWSPGLTMAELDAPVLAIVVDTANPNTVYVAQ
jgi:hypothetical protein